MVKGSLQKLIVITFSIIFFVVIWCPNKSGAKTGTGDFVSAKAAFLMDEDTGVILFQKNPDLRLPPASTTKVMTAIVALENAHPDKHFFATKDARQVKPCKIEIRPGEEWRMDDLLHCILLNSANDASVVIAKGTAGSVENFVRLMNSKAKKIGANHTRFANPHGLDQKNHYSTARDLALIFKYAMNNPTFHEMIQTESMSIQGPNERVIYLRNHNKLLGTFEGMVGGKTGYTRLARKCFVGEAQRNGKNLLVCVLGSKNHFQDVAKLLDYGFNGDETEKSAYALEAVQEQGVLREPVVALNTTPNQKGRYVLQVASFSDLEKALSLDQTLSDDGYPAFIEKSSLKNGFVRHRVKVGYYQDLTSAEKTKECIWKNFRLNSIILQREARAFP